MTAQAERAHWDSVAADDPSTMIRHGDWDQGIAEDLAMLPAPLHGRGPVLDLGCGIGRLTAAYARKHGVWTYGLDVSPAMIERARAEARLRRMTSYEVLTSETVSFAECDGRSLPGSAVSLGAAFSVLMFQHIPLDAQRSYVGQVAERLRPGARFTFQVVLGDEDTFLSHQVSYGEPHAWCADAGLSIEQCGDRWANPGWLWVTARKPE